MFKKILATLLLILTFVSTLKFLGSPARDNHAENDHSEIERTQISPVPEPQVSSTKSHDKNPKVVEPSSPEVRHIRVDFERIKTDALPSGDATFSKSYKLVLRDVELTVAPQTFQIEFDREVMDVTSVVIMGSEGASKITRLSFDRTSPELHEESKTLFEDDWHRSEKSFSKLKNIEFTASSKDKGRINIYLQVLGE